jgi:hypothetical protein
MSLPFIYVQIKNKGPQLQSGENSASVDQSTFFYLKKELENRSEWYGQRLEKYLYLNQSLFPTYQVQSSNQDLIADKSINAYDSGFATYDNCNYIGIGCRDFNGFFRRFQ